MKKRGKALPLVLGTSLLLATPLLIWRLRAPASQEPSSAATGPEWLCVFLARVDAIGYTHNFAGQVLFTDLPMNAGWVLSVTVQQVREGGAFAVGDKVNFAVHSPVKLLHDPGDEAVGKTYWLRYQSLKWKDGTTRHTLDYVWPQRTADSH
jgi:hypothetical protein